MRKILAITFILVCAQTLLLRADDPGKEVVIIYNTRLPESGGVADYYAKVRHVPANQIFGFELPTGEDMSRTEFSDLLQKPLAEALEKKKLWKMGSQSIPASTNHPARVERKPIESRIRY